MQEILFLVLDNLEKVGIGICLFLGAYLSNIGLGTWKSIKIDGATFDWSKIRKSISKFAVLILSIALLSVVVSIIPAYSTYVGIEIDADTMSTIDSLVIIGSFLYATVKYAKDAISKLSAIFNQ